MINPAIDFDPTIIAIWRQIVKDFPHHKERRLNTFAVLDNKAQLNTNNLEKSYQQYLDGYFWSREHAVSGSSRNTLKKEYDILFLENKQLNLHDIERNAASVELFISVASQADCEGCKRSWEQVDRDNREMLVAALQEFYSYKLYDDEGEFAWISPGRAATMNPVPTETGVEIFQFIREGTQNIEIFTTTFGVDNVRAQSVKLTLDGCLLPNIIFDYSSPPAAKRHGVVPCNTC